MHSSGYLQLQKNQCPDIEKFVHFAAMTQIGIIRRHFYHIGLNPANKYFRSGRLSDSSYDFMSEFIIVFIVRVQLLTINN